MLLHRREFPGLLRDRLQKLSSPVCHGNLAAAKHYRHLDLVFLFDKFFQMAKFDFEVMGVCFGAQLDFLELKSGLFFSGFLLLFVLLVLEAAIIHNFANRRFRIGRNFNQVKPELFRGVNGGLEGQNTQLLAFRVNDPDFLCLYLPIDFNLLIGISLLGYLTPPVSLSFFQKKNGR